MRSTPIGGRPFPGFGYTGSMRAHSARHGTTRSISARNCARRVVFVYFSKPVSPSVSCERLFISTSRSHVMWLAASQHNTRESGSLLQRFPSHQDRTPLADIHPPRELSDPFRCHAARGTLGGFGRAHALTSHRVLCRSCPSVSCPTDAVGSYSCGADHRS